MTMNEDSLLEGQPPIPSQPADPSAHSDIDKVVGEEVLQIPDYNAPPSEGAIKSTGPAADPGVGGAMGQPPPAARAASDVPEGSPDADLGENQGGGDEIADEMKAKH